MLSKLIRCSECTLCLLDVTLNTKFTYNAQANVTALFHLLVYMYANCILLARVTYCVYEINVYNHYKKS